MHRSTGPLTALLLLLAIGGTPPRGSDTVAGGQVQLPLQLLSDWVSETRSSGPGDAGFLLGNVTATVTAPADSNASTATVSLQLFIEVFDQKQHFIPLLPAGTAVRQVTVGGKPVPLSIGASGVGWNARRPGTHRMVLEYDVPLRRSEAGRSLQLPLPHAPGIRLVCRLPGRGLDVAVIPAGSVRTEIVAEQTVVHATLPATGGAQVSWRIPGGRDHVISRATYSGELMGESVAWTAELTVELLGTATVAAPVLPLGAALRSLEVDGKPATILVEGQHYAALIGGHGRHTVRMAFEVHLSEAKGPPRVEVGIVEVPVSRFELTLPGRKSVQVSPVASVVRKIDATTTRARLHVPMTRRVSIAWSEAVPDEALSELRANAESYHTLFAEEGVLYGRARVRYDINRGATDSLELALPAGVQLNRVDDNLGAVRDWRVSSPDQEQGRVVTVFLDRKVRGEIILDLQFDAGLGLTSPAIKLPAPLVRPLNVHRERGMLALLTSSMLTLNPLGDTEAIRVGENLLPPFVRKDIDKTVAHTYKYTGAPPELLLRASAPERVQGKFDARVDTLISIGEATLTATASVLIGVKSGGVSSTRLLLPPDVTLLNLTAPSMRSEAPAPRGEAWVDVEFTQEMTGQIRLELTYERLHSADRKLLDAPLITVEGAEVEQGRVAVEALSAVEVRADRDDRLTAVEIAELPRQLVLRTSNPILLAYKYVSGDTPPHLALEINRHRVLAVQEATIDTARYRTLFTADGLRITRASFMVRNSRKQFLRLQLPEGSEVWSASVDGRAVKPAMVAQDAATLDAGYEVLIKIIHSTEAFPVDLTFASSGAPLGRSGKIEGTLPRPDILATGSRWDIFLPADLRYGEPATNMEIADIGDAEHVVVAGEARRDGPGTVAGEPTLEIRVPADGAHLAFDKLYANQGPRDAWFSLSYRRSRR